MIQGVEESLRQAALLKQAEQAQRKQRKAEKERIEAEKLKETEDAAAKELKDEQDAAIAAAKVAESKELARESATAAVEKRAQIFAAKNLASTPDLPVPVASKPIQEPIPAAVETSPYEGSSEAWNSANASLAKIKNIKSNIKPSIIGPDIFRYKMLVTQKIGQLTRSQAKVIEIVTSSNPGSRIG